VLDNGAFEKRTLMAKDQNGKNPVTARRPADENLSVETTGLLNIAAQPLGARTPQVRAAFEQSNTTEDERKRGMLVLFAALVTVGMGQTLVFTILPPLARELGLQEWQVSAIFALSAICWVFSSPFWGRQSDVWGRKKAILIGTTGYTVSMFCFGFAIKTAQLGLLPIATAFALMVVTRAIFGLFGSSTNPAAIAYVADRTARSERAAGLGLLGAAMGVGVILGPGVAGALSAIDLLTPIYVMAFLGLCSGLAVWRFLPERTAPTHRIERPKLALRDPRVLPFVGFGILLSIVLAITVQTMTFYFMDRLGFAPKDAVQFVAVAFMASALAALFSRLVVVPRFGLSTRALMRVGIGLALLTYVTIILASTYGMLTFALVMQGLAFGMARPGFEAAASLAVTPREQGSVAGLLNSTLAVGHIVSPALVVIFYQGVGPQAPYVLCGLLMTVLFAALYIHPAFRVIREQEPTG
jgi:MFS family permease